MLQRNNSDASAPSRWFPRRRGHSPTTSTQETPAPNQGPHYTRRPHPTPPPRVLSPLGVAGRSISAPLSNPTLAAFPDPLPSPISNTPPRLRQISAPHSNPTLTSESLEERARGGSIDASSSSLLLSSVPTTRLRNISAPEARPTIHADKRGDINITPSPGSPSLTQPNSKTFVFHRPSDTAIELFFTRMVKSRGLIDLPGRTIDQQWHIVYNDQRLAWEAEDIPKKMSPDSLVDETPEWYITKLVKKTITLNEAEWLHVSLRHNDVTWFQKFLDMQGLHALGLCLALISRNSRTREKTENSIEYELVKSLQYVINNKSGLENALGQDLLITHIASSLNTYHIPTLKIVTDVLAVLVRTNHEKAFSAVLQGLLDLSLANNNLTSEPKLGCYDYWLASVQRNLVQTLNYGDVTQVKGKMTSISSITNPDIILVQYMLSTFHLANSIIIHSEKWDVRYQHRTQMEAAGLGTIVDIVKSCRWPALEEPILRLRLLGLTETVSAVSEEDVSSNNSSNASLPLPLPPPLPPPPSAPPFLKTFTAHHSKNPSLPTIIVETTDPPLTNGFPERRTRETGKRPDNSTNDGSDGEVEYNGFRIHPTPRLNIRKKRSQSFSGTRGLKMFPSRPVKATALRSASLRENRNPSTNGSIPKFSVKRKPVPKVLSTSSPSPFVDVKPLVRVLEELFADRGRSGRYRQLLACRKDNAQGLLDMFQRVLDVLEAPTPEFRRELIVAAQRLAGKSGLYPVTYDIQGITNISNFSEGCGGFADIFKGDFQGGPVCLKALRMNRSVDAQEFLKHCSKEAILWGQLSHPNLLPFYGIYHFRNGLALVSPWMEYGDINMYLKTHSDADRVLLASDVAHGLKFLHNNNVIHGDLKGPNILVDDTGTACVADFGLSSISDPNIPALTSYSSVASKGGSVRWQAPELINPESEDDIHNTIESDVYAYSCVLYEIFVAKLPFYQYPRDHTVSFKVMSGERPVQPEKGSPTWGDWGLTNDIWSMMQKCWSAEVKKRPTVDNIIERLRAGLGKDGRVDKKRSSLAPAHFRELVREGVDPVDMSVEAFEALLKGG